MESTRSSCVPQLVCNVLHKNEFHSPQNVGSSTAAHHSSDRIMREFPQPSDLHTEVHSMKAWVNSSPTAPLHTPILHGTTPVPLPLRPASGSCAVQWHSLRNEIMHHEEAAEGGRGNMMIAVERLIFIHLSNGIHQAMARRVPHPSFADGRQGHGRCPLVYRGGLCAHAWVCVGWMGGCDLYMGHVEWDSVKTHLEMHVYYTIYYAGIGPRPSG